MGKVLQARGTESPFTPASVRINLADLPVVYVTFDILIPAVVVTDLDTNDGACAVLEVSRTGLSTGPTLFAGDANGSAEWMAQATPTGDAIVGDTWLTIGLQVSAGTPVIGVIQQDGVEIFNGTIGVTATGFDEAIWGALDPFNGTGDADYTLYFDNLMVGTTGFGSSDIFSEDFEGVNPLSNFDATSGDVSVVDDPFPPPTPVADRFYEGYPWRFIVTNLNTRTLTLLDRLQTDRRVVARLGAAWEHSGVVPSYSPEVNILRSGSTFDPFVQEGISLIYGFRREGSLGSGDGPWVIRYAGVLLQVEDDADTDLSLSTLRSWDPWMYLYKRPVRDPDTGRLPGPSGLVYNGPADEIAVDLIFTTTQFDGDCFIDLTLGQVDPCDSIQIPFQRGMSVGEALDALMATQTCEIMFTPVYEPLTLPGITSTLNVAPELGQQRNSAIMAWDKPSRSLTGLNRRLDGTRRVNIIQAYAGQGGDPVAEFDDATSVARFGVYYEQPFIVGNTGQTEATESNALRQLSLRSYGERTYQVTPATARAPIALRDYEPGDTIPVYASQNFREQLAEDLRIMEIPIDIDDNAIENVSRMSLAPVPTTES